MNQTILQPLQIESFLELGDLCIDHGLPLATKIGPFCIRYFSDHPEADSITISFHKDMMPTSYVRVPQMFANSIALRCRFPSVQAFLKGDYLVVVAGQSRIPVTFLGKAVTDLKKKGKFICHEKNLPPTYRNHSVLTSLIKKKTGRPIKFAIIAKDTPKAIFIWTFK